MKSKKRERKSASRPTYTLIDWFLFRPQEPAKGTMKPDLRSLLAHSSLLAEPGVGREHNKALQSAAMRRIIQRIREVIARSDLAIPLTGAQAVVDPNTIAEYLDGVLPPDRAAEIEELCLAADKYLAEVAGCREALQTGSQAGAWEGD